MARVISDEEKLARSDFLFIEREYKKTKAKVEKIKAELLKAVEEKSELESKVLSLIEKRETSKETFTILKYEVEVEALKTDLSKLSKNINLKTEELNKLAESVDFVNKTFSDRIPEGQKLLEEMKLADMEERMNVKKLDLNHKELRLEQEAGALNFIKDNLNLDPDLKLRFGKMVEHHNSFRTLLEKQSKSKDKKLSPKDEAQLADLKKEFNNNKKEIRNYCRKNGLSGFDLKEFETTLLRNKNLEADGVLKLLLDENTANKKDLLVEKQIVKNYYEEKQAQMTAVEVEEVVADAPAEESKESLWSRIKNKFKTDEPIREDEEEVELVEVSFWDKMKSKFNSFVDKFKKEKEAEVEEEVEEEKAPEEVKADFSKTFTNKMKSSEYFKEQLKVEKEIEDVEIAKRLQAEKEKLIKKTKELEDEISR